jgi:hypothetical protein
MKPNNRKSRKRMYPISIRIKAIEGRKLFIGKKIKSSRYWDVDEFLKLSNSYLGALYDKIFNGDYKEFK